MKEVILKSDLEKWLQDEKKWWEEQWLSSEAMRGGAITALDRILVNLWAKHSNLKGGETDDQSV